MMDTVTGDEKRGSGRCRDRRRGVAAAAAALAIAASTVVITTPAHAANGYDKFEVINSHLYMEEAGAYTGAAVIQDVADNGTYGNWTFEPVGAGSKLVNQESGLCVNTDGVAGHLLTMQPCDGRIGEYWGAETIGTGVPLWVRIRNNPYNLVVEVRGGSTSPHVMDAAPWNGGTYQVMQDLKY